ncbi:MAG TPA: thioredoxin-dependent thiol peroxidase [Bacteroidales bacterium]|nr:thioredoxin-dependent thiol peroxidase [Bacteroidales bacterium]
MSSILKVGDPAPDFESVDQEGRPVSLKALRGKKVILYFYPKDNTPGCTAEACNLRDNYQILKKKGFIILGVSPDDERSHKNFSSKYVLPFALISDKATEIIRSYGAWGKKKLYGKEYEGLLRTTFIIDGNGIISHILPKVDTKNHTAQILKVLGDD